MIRLAVIRLAMILAAPLGLAHHADAAADRRWVGAWGASPSTTTGSRRFQNTTFRQIVRFGASGSMYRLRLSNALTGREVTLGMVHVANPKNLANPKNAENPKSGANPKNALAIDAATDRAVTFAGQVSVIIPAGASVLSDPIVEPVQAKTQKSVSLFVAESRSGLTGHLDASATGFFATGNQVTAPALVHPFPAPARVILSGVDVLADPGGGTIVTLGDSITDGFRSTTDTNRRWPDILVDRLQGHAASAGIGVVNAGIAGNRLLRDNVGTSGLARLPRDVLALPNLRFICVLEGVNDITVGAAPRQQRVTAAMLIAGYQQIIAQGHEVGAKVLLGTITPTQGSPAFSATNEAIRQTVNAWIRGGRGFDGVLDFDAAIRDPSLNTRILPAYDSGDHLHPSDAGYAAMANAIRLDLFAADDSKPTTRP